MAYRWRMTHRYGCHTATLEYHLDKNPPDQTQYNAAPAHSPRTAAHSRIRHEDADANDARITERRVEIVLA